MVQLSDLPLRQELRGVSPYGAPQLSVRYRLNTNENPYAPSEAIINDFITHARDLGAHLNRYPDRDAIELRQALASYISQVTGVKITLDNVWAANGSNEIIQQLLQAFGGPGRSALGFSPSYSMHPIIASGTQTEFISVPRAEENGFAIDMPAALEVIKQHRPHIVFITTPNNPTGNITSSTQLRAIIQAAPGIVIVDEAYAEFSDEPSAVKLLAEYPKKLVVSRTMSKAFDFAGGRIGYFVADPAFVEAALLVRLPYHLSTFSQAAARAALAHSADTLATVETLRTERGHVAQGLRECGYDIIEPHGNFIFFGRFDDAAAAWKRFLKRDVLIRDVGVPGWLRVTIGLPEENDAFLVAASEVLGR